MAFLTRSDVMRPLLVRFLINAAFVEPVDIQAIASRFGSAVEFEVERWNRVRQSSETMRGRS